MLRRLLRAVLWILAALSVAALVVFVIRTGSDRTARKTTIPDDSSRIEGFTFEDLVGSEKRLSVAAGVGTFDDSGNFTVEDVRRVEVYREGKPPLVARAQRGAGTGPQGQRVIRLEGGVEVFDQEAGVRALIPSLEIDQATGLARSLGEVVVEGGGLRGRADAVVYGLEDRPTEVFVLDMQGSDGSSLSAGHAVVASGERRLELTDSVRLSEGGATLRSQRIVLYRNEQGRPERAEISLGLEVDATFPDRPALNGKAEAGEVTWTSDGELDSVVLEGRASLVQAKTSLDAERIRATRIPAGGWNLEAEGNVHSRGITRKGDAVLEAEAIVARTDRDGSLLQADANGAVAFRSEDAVAGAGRARFRPSDPEYPVVLDSADGGRARVASGRTRVAALTIRTDAEGTRMWASGRVEASLLPEVSRESARRALGPFRDDEAVHFVARDMETREGGTALSFRGEVRGWQGERHLSADVVELDDRNETLVAIGNVLSRFPDPARPQENSSFLQISADRLDYSGKKGSAVYQGTVRVRQREGWLEAERLEIDIENGEGKEIKEIRAAGSVRFEYRPADLEADQTPARGTADRMRHDPVARVLRLIGDRIPAEVRRPGEKGGSTRGRVLRYELDSGSVEVESSAAEPFR